MLTAGLGTTAAAMGVAAGQVCVDPGGEALLRRTLEKIASVAATCGAQLDEAAVEQTLQFIRRFPDDATTSLQRDLAAGRPSEHDSLVGSSALCQQPWHSRARSC
jgi:2-dehydropantoate 2-reductase